jgi:hypothetical protein
MKKLSLAVLMALVTVLPACTREKEQTINPKILGKWMLDRTVEEEYYPVNTMTYSEEINGKAGDSVVFLVNKIAVTYTDDGGVSEDDYEMINDSTLVIEYETYKIRKLTATEFYLHEEDVDNSANEKWIYKIYMKR